MSINRQNQNTVPLDYNNLGGANQNDNYNQNYNKMNSMNGYPRGSYVNEINNNNINSGNYISNNAQNQQNFSNAYDNRNYNQNNRNYTPNLNQRANNQNNMSLNNNINIRSPSPRQIRMEELERKKTLLNNIQSQINLTRQTKLEQMNKNKEEDAKYLRDMMIYYPFGRGGGGAPIRDKSGNIVTNRRSLISDPKYNLASINVDDDYYEVWDKEKRIGRFYNNNLNNNNINNNNYNNQQLNNTAKNFRGNDYYNNNNQDLNNNNNQNYFNNDNYQQQNNGGRPYSTNPRLMNNNNNYNYNNNNNLQNMDYYPEQDNNNYQNNPQYYNTLQRPNTQTISLTYDNYEVNNNDQQMQIKENYRQDLLRQIKENEEKKLREKRRKREEEEKEEERLRREREELERQEQDEKNKNKQKLDQYQNDNNILANERNKNNLQGRKRILKSNVQIDEDNNMSEKEAFERIHEKELESKMQLNNEILKLREQMKEQQSDLFNQIAFLKQETQNANQQRFQALKEIDKLKDELSKQRNDEILRRKYVYDVVVNEAKDANNIVQESHLPKNDKPKVVLPVDSEKDIYYEERIRHPNRVLPVPKLTELNEHGVKTDSKFIDIDTHNLVSGLELYEPNEKLISSQDEDFKINNRGIGIEGDYGTLRGNDNIMRTSDVLMPNSTELNTNQVNLSINNQKMKTFKNIKNVETIKDERTDNININLESIDDCNFEVNKIYNKNLERLRYLNDIENNFTPKKNYDLLKNNVMEKDNFDEFIKKLNKPVPKMTTDNDEEFEIEISKVPK